MATMTISEALAEIRTIAKRLPARRANAQRAIVKIGQARDPHEDSGGSEEYVRRERQAVLDLERRHIKIRLAIQEANLENSLTVTLEGGTTIGPRTVAEWLVWRKEIAPGERAFVEALRRMIEHGRDKAATARASIRTAEDAAKALDSDVIVYASSSELDSQADELEQILGVLDGKLTTLNSTTTISIDD